MTWLLDSVVVSELRKANANPGVTAWAEDKDPVTLYLSAISILELDLGIRLKERVDPRQGARLRAWLEGVVLPVFAGRVLPLDVNAARATAGLHVPDSRPERDAMIAGTALVHGLTVVTRNVRHFEPMRVPVVDPWTD